MNQLIEKEDPDFVERYYGVLQKLISGEDITKLLAMLVSINKINNETSLRNPDWVRKDFSVAMEKTKSRYVKICAKNLTELPYWHPEAGGKPWLMVDEIIVE